MYGLRPMSQYLDIENLIFVTIYKYLTLPLCVVKKMQCSFRLQINYS